MDSSIGKKINFEDLGKDELVKKCKTFLAIIQKAKQSKSLLQQEIDQLKEKVETIEAKEKSEVPTAIDEIIQDLTQQKLNFVSTIEDLRLKNDCLVTNLNHYKEDKKRLDVELNRLDSENIAYARQVTRLSDENEQLISHLESLEKQIEKLNKIGIEQQNQLLELEESNNKLDNTKQYERIQELEKMLSRSLEEIQRMKDKTEVEFQENSQSDYLDSQIDRLKLVKIKEKMKSYHSKIVKLAANIKELKQDKESILGQFKLYTDQVRDWKDKLNIASEKLLVFVKECEKENDELKKGNQVLKDLNMKFMEQLEAHKTDDEKSKELEEMDTLKMRNSKLSGELEELKSNLNKLSLENELILKKLQDENIMLKKQIEELQLEKENSLGDIQRLHAHIDELLLENQAYSKQSAKFQDEIEKNNEKFNHLNVEIENYKDEIEKITVLNETIRQKLQLESENQERVMELEEAVKTLNNELEKSKATERQLAEKSGEEMLKLVSEIESLTEKSMRLQEKVEQFEKKEERNNCKLVNADIQTENDFVASDGLIEEVQLLRSENSQLLTEMNEMNQELKGRGENLSKLEAHCEEIKKKIQIYETQANKNVNNISEKEETIMELKAEINALKDANGAENDHEKDQEILRLKSEIETLTEKINSNNDYCNYAESDMSTSTISRAEEMDRMRDLEGSWEEKYSKLKNLAIKLKAKLKEQTTEFNKEKIQRDELQQKLNNNYDSLKTTEAKYHQLCEELEQTKEKCVEYSKKIEKDESNFISITEQMKDEIEDLKKYKVNTDMWKKQISVKVQALRKELAEKDALTKDLESKLLKVNEDLQAKEQVLKLEMDNHKQTKNSLQHFTHENKKNTVLNLEMQDYEKSVKDLSQKLEKKQDQITKLKGQIDSQKGAITTLKEQNNILEEKIRVYENDLDIAVNETVIFKKKTTELESLLQVKEEEISSLNQQLEIIRSRHEELSTELSRDIAERQKIIIGLKEEKENLYLHNLNLQQTNRELQQKLSLKDEEFSTISNEYENYKIRAQSVLRQNQSRDIGLEEKLNGNVSILMSQVETLNSELLELRNSNDSLMKENEALRTENGSLVQKYEQVLNEISEKKCNYDQLLSKYNQALSEHNEAVRSLKVHAETLGQCYRQQLTEQEVRHNREIVELQSKIEKAPSPTEMAPQSLPTMPREAGEGSESIESLNNLPVPLEKLLSDGEDQQVNILKVQIGQQASKLAHLTELLADTEQDLVKHVQMNKVLKEEIRRQQRAVEREKHAENLEYLKNVVFKFITLNSGDERSRLVPVLNTILKLSPEEAQSLDLVAKGDPGGLKAWSSYLPMWSSPNKP